MTGTKRQRKQLFLMACAALMLALPAVGAQPAGPADSAGQECSIWPILDQLPATTDTGLADTGMAGMGRLILVAAGPVFQGGAQSGSPSAKALVSNSQIIPFYNSHSYTYAWGSCAAARHTGASHSCRAPPLLSSFPV